MVPALAPTGSPVGPAEADAYILNVSWGCRPTDDAGCQDPGPWWISQIQVFGSNDTSSDANWNFLGEEVTEGPNGKHQVSWEHRFGYAWYGVVATGWRRLNRCPDGGWTYEVRQYVVPRSVYPDQPFWEGHGYVDLHLHTRVLPYYALLGYLDCDSESGPPGQASEPAADPPTPTAVGAAKGGAKSRACKRAQKQFKKARRRFRGAKRRRAGRARMHKTVRALKKAKRRKRRAC